MWLVILEAVGAGALLVFIVWWTMFAGRPRGEREEAGGSEDATGRPGASPEQPGRDGPAQR